MLKIVIADTDPHSAELLCSCIRQAVPGAGTERFLSAQEALGYLSREACDVLFIDADMEDGKGRELVRRLRMSRPGLNVILTAASDASAGFAMEQHASGYIRKPVTPEAVQREMNDLRYPADAAAGQAKRIRAQCFGNFELFADGRVIRFKYKKTRELVAYLIDRCGAVCSGPEIMATLWEEDMKEHPEYLKSLIRDLNRTLTELGCENILEKQWGGLGIRPELIECDFYNWKRGLRSGLNTYRGEYMSQYSWGEFTNAAQFSGADEPER